MRGFRFLACMTAGVGFAGFAAAASADAWIQVGPAYRGGMEADASGSSHTQNQGVHAAGALRSPSGVGSTGSYADRNYDDGYVRRDPGTGNPASIDPSVTWYWGYDNNSQYNSGADTLTFHKTGSQGYQEVLNTSISDDDKMDGYGAEIVGGMPLKRGSLNIDLCLGLQGIFGAEATLGGTTYEEGIGRRDITDTYDVSGINMPGAGHRGTYDGPFDNPPVIPSPTIPNQPESRSSTIRDMQWSARNHIDMDVETDLYELWLGPRLAFQAGDRLALHVTPKVSATYVDACVDRTETFVATYADGSSATLNSWSDSGSESKFVLGAGVVAGAELEFENGMFAGIWGGYEWVSEDVDVQVGPNTVSVDASGYTAGAVIGYRFGGGAPRAAASHHRLPDLPVEAVSSAQTPAPEPRDTAARSASVSEDDLNAPVPVRRVEASREAEVSAKAAAGTAETQAVCGERAYNELRTIAKASKDKEMVRHAVQTMKKYEPEQYAALTEHVRQRKAQRAQLAMR
jgi:hypothetical protein